MTGDFDTIKAKICECLSDLYNAGKSEGYLQGVKDGHTETSLTTVPVKDFQAAVADATELGRQQGMEDAWRCARRLVSSRDDAGLSVGTLVDVFGTGSGPDILASWEPQDAIDKLAAWQESAKERDCDHCSRKFGTLGCCDTDNNKWIYHCAEGKKEYAEQHADKQIRTGDGHEVSYTDYANARSTIEDLISKGCSVEMLSKIVSQVTSS